MAPVPSSPQAFRWYRPNKSRFGEILPLLDTWTDDILRVLGDLGYEGEQATITVAYKKPKNAACSDVQSA